jgi:parallel beta-helix repeat protein
MTHIHRARTSIACVAVALTVAAVAAPSGSTASAISLHKAGARPVTSGVNLRLAVRGDTGRLVIGLTLTKVGSKPTRHQSRVIRRLHGRRLVTFYLRSLHPGSAYRYVARAVSGSKKAKVVRGTFHVAAAAGSVTSPVLTASAAGPAVTTGVADQVTTTTALLHGTVNPSGSATTAWFQWDPTANLGHQTPHRAYAATAGTSALQDSVTGLVPGRTYNYRIASTNANGTTYGATRTFTTAVTAGSPTTPTSPLPPPTGPTYYVSTTGSDTADGSAAHPWKTLAKAAAATPAGATALVAAGTYSGFNMTRSGRAGAPIAIQAQTAGSVHVRPASGGTVITISGQHYVTLTGLIVEGATGTANAGVDVLDGSSYITIAQGTVQNNHSYGIDVNGSTYVTISGNTISGNDTGIRINRNGAGVLIDSNDVANNSGMVVDDPTPGNDWGAVGISFLHTDGPLIARNNTIHGNRGQSDDYGYDGGAFEIYGSSGATMTGNRIWDNQDVLETGTDGAACARNVFTRNVSWGGNDKSKVSPRGPLVNGIILRCGAGMLIANNSFYDMDYYVYDIDTGGGHAASIAGFRILNNVNYQLANKIYALVTSLPSDAIIDYNVSFTVPFAPFASVPGNGNVTSIASFRSLTGQDTHGNFANPLYANIAGQDFHLTAGSPALNAGTPIAGVTDGYIGRAPDDGAYETG